MTVPDLSTKPVPRSWRAREARVHVAIAGAAGAGAWVLHAQDIPDDELFFRSIVWFTVAAAALSGMYALAVVLVRRFPAARATRLDGRPAVLLRSWPGRWWLISTLDLGLLVLTGFWVLLAWSTSADRVFLTVLALVPFAWFAGRWTTRAAGRCRREALWVTENEIVHDSERGRSRVARPDVVRVQGWDDADGAATAVMAVISSAAPDRSCGPRLLTLTRTPTSGTRTTVETTHMGHPAHEIAAWLTPVAATAEPGAPAHRRRGLLLRWLP